MANHLKDDRKTERPAARGGEPKPNSRAAIRAQREAEEREKQAWIAERKRQEREAAAAEEREKQAWIAERKRQEREAAAAAEREKQAWIARRKQEEQEAEEAARRREKEAKAAARQKKAEQNAEKRRKLMKSLKITALVVLSLVVVLGVAGVFVGYHISNLTTNFPNVYLNGIDVGGLTKEETAKKLDEQGWETMVPRTLEVQLPMGVSFTLDREEAGLLMDRDAAVETAYAYGHSKNVVENVLCYFRARVTAVNLTGKRTEINRDYIRDKAAAAVEEFREKTSGKNYVIDTEAKELHFIKGAGDMDLNLDDLCAAAEEAMKGEESVLVYEKMDMDLTEPDFDALYKELNVEPVDAFMDPETFEVKPETVGCTFDPAEARRLWEAAEPMEEIVIPLEILEPEVTAEELTGMLFRDCLGSQTSSFGGSTQARINNINLAASKINGVILMPGETFSYNDTVGQRTIANGFQEAAAYSNGEVVQEVGGGICQVSSTLYCATLYARMTTVSRTNHYFRVSYLPLGQDATVSWRDPDFKFRNDREYPVKIVAYCNNDTLELTIEIWGTDTDGIYVTLSYEQYAVHDTEYPEVVIGSNVYLYIHYYDKDGNFLYTVEGPDSTYFKHEYEIDWPPEKDNPPSDDGGETGGDGGETGGGETGGGETGGGDTGGGETGGGDTGGGDEGGGTPGDVIIENP